MRDWKCIVLLKNRYVSIWYSVMFMVSLPFLFLSSHNVCNIKAKVKNSKFLFLLYFLKKVKNHLHCIFIIGNPIFLSLCMYPTMLLPPCSFTKYSSHSFEHHFLNQTLKLNSCAPQGLPLLQDLLTWNKTTVWLP